LAKFKAEKRICKNCDEEYEVSRYWQKFCSDKCRTAYYRKTHPQISAEELKRIKDRLGIRE